MRYSTRVSRRARVCQIGVMCFTAIVVVTWIHAPVRAQGSASFIGLGPEGYTPLGVNSSGSLVAGTAGFQIASQWTDSEGWTLRSGTSGICSSPVRAGAAYAASPTGGWLVGTTDGCAARWNSDGTTDMLGVPVGEEIAIGTATSSDAQTIAIVGSHSTSTGYDDEAYLWSQPNGFERLYTACADPDVCRFRSTDRISGISADGTVAVGRGQYYRGSSLESTTAYRWTASGGPVPLWGFAGFSMWSDALGISGDGRVAVGASSRDTQITEAVRWLADGTFEPLGVLAPTGSGYETESSYARATSGDGSVVIGTSNSTAFGFYSVSVEPSDGGRAFIWTAADGMQDLREMLISRFGLPVDDWKLVHATAISPDGQIIVGMGVNPEGFAEGWMVRLPEPSSVLLFACFISSAVAARRVRHGWPRQERGRGGAGFGRRLAGSASFIRVVSLHIRPNRRELRWVLFNLRILPPL